MHYFISSTAEIHVKRKQSKILWTRSFEISFWKFFISGFSGQDSIFVVKQDSLVDHLQNFKKNIEIFSSSRRWAILCHGKSEYLQKNQYP